MAAAAGATGARTWLQTRDTSWLTPKRIKAATIALFVAAFGFSTIGLSSSSSTPTHPSPAVSAGQQQHLATASGAPSRFVAGPKPPHRAR
jgi:hypothetical protein